MQLDHTQSIALDALRDTTTHIYMSGNAGTGKSTLLRQFIDENRNSTIVLAPTGIAAVNIGGQTIHSFFKLPARSVSYNAIKVLDRRNPLDQMMYHTIRRASYIIIDEISMVRADLMDCIMWFFQKNFPNLPPFGGKKLIMVGDLNQLPPVIATEADREMLVARYESEYFFHSKAWTTYANFEKIELTKIWRQSDPEFISFLGKLRNNDISTFEIDRFNQHCHKPETEFTPDMGVVLCSTNKIAQELNQRMIQMEEGETIELIGKIEGNFGSDKCPVDQTIHLKKGCRVMTVRNGAGYYNGSIGEVVGLDINGDLIIDINGDEIHVQRHEFVSNEFVYDKENDRINTTETGKFYQHPVRIAYAMTIHKSQGCTFDKIIVDLGERGAFAHGQTYVALSRCTSMQGITLRYPLQKRDIIYSKSVLEFNNK